MADTVETGVEELSDCFPDDTDRRLPKMSAGGKSCRLPAQSELPRDDHALDL